jgi:hypothetical protein
MKILIAGDSFAAKWPNTTVGWVDLLSKDHDVTNVAQAGVGEYKIYKQIENINQTLYDCIIVSHTSPSRIHTPNHPIHTSGFHKDCDLILTDISEKFSFFDNRLKTAQGWFKYHYDDTYQLDIYRLLRKEINSIITIPYISLSHIEILKKLSIEKNHFDFSKLWENERGSVNHYTEKGNKVIFELLSQFLRNKEYG